MKYTTIILLLLPTLLWAQDIQFRLETNTIPVTMDGWNPYEPWAGGVMESNPDLADLDADGDWDIVIGSAFFLPCFLNIGSFSQPLFSYSPQVTDSIQTIGWTAPELCDIDNDSDLDLFATSNERVWFWENVGMPQAPQWQFVTDSLEQITWWAINLDFIDIDADGDLDLFTGGGGPITFYRNQGTPEILNLVMVTMSFEGINVGAHADPAFVDIDADGDYDLFIGERYGEIWYYRNDGDSVNYNFTYVTNFFDSIDVGDYSSPEFADIDGDGDYDMFVGRESNAASPLGDVFFYENVGTPQGAEFQLVAKNYLMVDLDKYVVRPQLVDINADGAKDLIATSWNRLDYFVNIGDSLQAEYILTAQEFQGIYEPTLEPFFVDIDGDGDYDLFCGEGAIPGPPSLALYLNYGTARNPDLQLYSSQFVTNPNFFVVIVPVLADIDADGDFDLFIFDDMDHFYFYQNNGTPQWPVFQLISNQWQGIHQFPYPDNGWYDFTFADLDGDLDLDLLIGSPAGDNLYFYRNQGSPQVPQMVLETEIFLPGSYPYIYTPYLVDIDADEDYDLFIGHTNGGMLFFRNITGDSTGAVQPRQTNAPYRGPVLSIGPNPANPLTVISCKMQVASQISLEVFDISGKKVVELASGFHLPGEYRYVWDASKNASGMYVIRLKTPQFNTSQKLMIVK